MRVKAGAKTYSGGSLASFVYSRDHIVKELSGKRAGDEVIDEVFRRFCVGK